VWDDWWHIDHLFDVSQHWFDYIQPGTWPDCDMIPLGRLSIRGERGSDRMSNLTKDEQYTLMTLFTVFRSPLFFGGDLPSNDAFTLSLLTNEEVLSMHAGSTDVHTLYVDEDKVAISSRHEKMQLRYLAVFNRSDSLSLDMGVHLSELGFSGKARFSNLWTGEEVGVFTDLFTQHLRPHASGLYKVEPVIE
jgi:hypothetical protein